MKGLGAVAAIAAVLFAAACGGGSAVSAPSATNSGPFQLRGELFVYASVDSPQSGAQLCQGSLQHPDLHGGTDVVVRGKDNTTTVGLGKLSDGESRASGALCAFTFTVDDVEGGQGFYTLTIGDQDPQNLTEDEARNGYQTYRVGP